jgi:YidC/Oxa1 family membrane protein insertase
MEKRVILAFVLSFAVLYAFRALYTPPPAAVPEPSTSSPAPPASNTPAEAAFRTSEVPSAVPIGDVRGEKPEELVFETPLYSATFSNVGAVLKSFKLKQYTGEEGHPLELINQEAGSKVGWPLAVETGDKAVDDEIRNAQFASQREPNRLVLQFASNGLHVRKVVQFDSENYLFTLETTLTKDARTVPHVVVWQGSFGDQSLLKGDREDPTKKNAVYQVDSAFKRIALRGLKDQPQNFTSLRVGVEDQYFLAMFLSPQEPREIKVGKHEYPGSDGKPIPTLVVSMAVPEGKPLGVYVGPKQEDWLSKADPQLAAALDYGYFGFIAKPLVACLLWLHSYIGNFGWAIILLTVALNLVLFPLALKQQTSMVKMQKIQPQMKRLQDQYKKLKPTDPRRAQVQAEMMNLYKEHGVNPMGGCLPLLLQMPLLFGFYSALAYSIELRRAPWILWIKDLSQHDPYYVLPILMAVAMIIQQKLTPTASVDPAQARMMMIMPVMMTFLFLFYSSGLSLYWLTSSVVGVVRQVVINKYWSPQAEAKLKARPRQNERDEG